MHSPAGDDSVETGVSGAGRRRRRGAAAGETSTGDAESANDKQG